MTETEESRNEDLDSKEKNYERVKNNENIKKYKESLYKESDRAFPCNVYSSFERTSSHWYFLLAEIDYLPSFSFTLILTVVVYWWVQ